MKHPSISQEEPCEHEWVVKKERITPERTNSKQPQFTKSGAYFVYKVCSKCNKRLLTDYTVEP